ncbi:MAG: hypothetical protein DI598_06145 [Pseudopedobacter saltans]|uniref:Uncharacterized protein n=1 Tax=Pseudopedobacter saltans TaxID=151895 RepID=A0A2W5F5X2_9SPHI|nr:MAG: hypothetical protein DI598_06145 [Pseudopedobacter saltans]
MYRLLLILIVFYCQCGFSIGQIKNYTKAKEQPDLLPNITSQIPSEVRLVGLGDVQFFLKESAILNNSIAKKLITERHFNTYIMSIPDWRIRELNTYLNNEKAFASTKQEYDSLFLDAFSGTIYNNPETKEMLEWIKTYNDKNWTVKVKIIGSGFVGFAPQKLPAMNKYIINTYLKPMMSANEIQNALDKNSDVMTIESDSAIVWFLSTLEDKIDEFVSSGQGDMDAVLLGQMQYDYSQRRAASSIYLKRLPANVERFRLLSASYDLETKLIDSLLKDERNKIIYPAIDNFTFSNIELIVSDNDGNNLKIQSGDYYREKYKNTFFSSVIAFSDSVKIFRIKDGNLWQSVVEKGDSLTRALKIKKSVYTLPKDAKALRHFAIPVYPKGIWGMNAKYQFTTGDNPFDMLIILDSLQRNSPVDGKRSMDLDFITF